ncbi:four helix bundle protein [Owenweeksia hongkongensis]|uniref:four helix bundle protein n=1 Tax=Owenweeksia hongkongensis TaxID=253245 RepID=UPI003A92F729
MRGFKDLLAYQKAFDLAMEIFMITKSFPKEETYSLTDQIRRSSRSVCANLAEAYRKRSYLKHFLLKVTDCQMENSETEVWLDFSLECKYITEDKHTELLELNDEVGKLLYHIYNNPNKYGVSEKE